MAIIYSYPLNDDIKSLDELVGTTEKNINGQLKTVTRNFLLQDLAEFFIVDGGLQKEIILTTDNSTGPATLNQVTGILNIPRYDIGSITSISAIAPITATTGTAPVISTSMSANKLIGRYSTGTGVFEEITLGTGLSFTGNILNSTALVTPAALTKIDDTNVTLTLGGSPSNALLQGVSLTLGWTGTLEDSRITSSSNWNTAYNNRITSLTTTGSGAATLVSNTLNIPTLLQATSSVSGYLSSTDFTTFTNKENSANKQNSLAVDGTGTKFPTVDAVNAGISGVISNVVNLTGNQSINGQKAFINNDTTLGGIKVLANKTTGGSTYGDGAGIFIAGTGGNYGILIDGTFSAGIRNVSSGSSLGIFSSPTTSNSYGFYSQNTSTGVGIYSKNEVGGVGMRLENLLAATGKPFQYLKAGVEKFNILDNGTANYITDLSSSYTDRTLVDKGYITSYTTAQLAGKMNNPSLTASYIPKALTATTIGNSRLLDTGTYLGIGTVNAPTKDITLGNQGDKEIGIEQSDNTSLGRSLTVQGGRTTNFVPNSDFNIVPQVVARGYFAIFGSSNGDVYGVSGGSLYKRTGGGGEFNLYSIGISDIRGLFITSADDMYICADSGLYKQTGLIGAFSLIVSGTVPSRIAVAPNGDIYGVTGVAFFGSDDVYKLPSGGSSFSPLGFALNSYSGIAVSNDGSVFVGGYYTGIYKQTLGIGVFTQISALASTALIIDPFNNLYTGSWNSGRVSKLTNLTGVFNYVSSVIGEIDMLGSDVNGNIYAYSSGVLRLQVNYVVGSPNLAGGTLKLASGTGKGTGDSNLDMYTGQKTASGTDMQIETLRARINNEGLMTLPSVTNTLIEADATGKAVVTKEYLTNVVGSQNLQQVTNIGATTTNSITANSFIKIGGLATEYLMADGTTTTGSGGDFVPYTGATSDVNLGEFGIQLGNLEFDNTPTNIPTAAGSMYYNDADGTVDLILKGGNVTLQVGQETVIRVVNKTATNISLLESNYQAVRITGAQGQRPKVDLAQATNDELSAETIGLVTETIANNQEGFITTSGLVRNINTTGSLQGETWLDGDILYLSPTVAGNITKVKPVAPNHLIIIGYVIHAHITQGTIFVKVDNGYELGELHNVKINGVANNNVLAYTSSTSIWENKTVETALGYTPANDASVMHLAGTETITGVKTFGTNLKTAIPYQNIPTIAGIAADGGLEVLYTGTYPNQTEISYVKGVTSAIQEQLNNKAPLASPTFTGTVVLPSTTSIGTVSSTEIGYLDNVTSSIQTQLDAKVTSVTGTAPVVSSGGTTPAISIAAATGSIDGYLTAANWTTFNNKLDANTWIDYSSISTIVGWSAYTTKTIKYTISGKLMFIQYNILGTSNSSATSFTLPFSSPASSIQQSNNNISSNNSTVYMGYGLIGASSSLVTFYYFTTAANQTSNWTASGNKSVRGILILEIA